VSITDKRMTRFWITLDQGVQFVLHCLERMQGGEVFVPKIPSMRVIDLAEAVAPDARVDVVGIRPGEKLHEALVAEDEARTGVELEDMYVLYPGADGTKRWPDGKLLPEGFRYTSDTNTRWLTREQLHAMVEA